MVSWPVAAAGTNSAAGLSRHHCTVPSPGSRPVFAFPHGRLAPTVQTMTCPWSQRNTVVSVATRAGIFMPNVALTAGTSASGIGCVVSSVPMRLQNAEGVSAPAGTAHPMAMITSAAPKMHPALVPDRIDDTAILPNNDSEPVRISPHVGDPVGWLQDPRGRGQGLFGHGVVVGNARRSGSALRD